MLLRLATLLTLVLVAFALLGREVNFRPKEGQNASVPQTEAALFSHQDDTEEARQTFCEKLDGTADCSNFLREQTEQFQKRVEDQFCGGKCPPEVLPVPDPKSSPLQYLLALQRIAERLQEERLESDIRSGCNSKETVVTLRRVPGFTTAGFFCSLRPSNLRRRRDNVSRLWLRATIRHSQSQNKPGGRAASCASVPRSRLLQHDRLPPAKFRFSRSVHVTYARGAPQESSGPRLGYCSPKTEAA
jgi:hypothetical protein